MAHAHGVKLLASLGGAAQNANNWLGMARDSRSERAFFDNLEKLIKENNYDGVDIDWEPSALTDEDQATYTDFMKALRARFPTWIITTALGAGDYYGKHISWAEVAKQVDWINWMTYDFAGNWTGHSAHNANLYPPSDPKVDGGVNIDQNLKEFEASYNLPPDKVVLGIPFYGIQFFSQHMGDPFDGTAGKQGDEIQYYEVVPLLSSQKYKDYWDEGAKAPYFEKVGGGLVGSYDNPKSVRLKCEYAQHNGLKGVMVWNLGADVVAEHTPLLDAIAQAFGLPTMTMPAQGLLQTVQTFMSSVGDLYGKLTQDQKRLLDAGMKDAAQQVDPGTQSTWAAPATGDSTALGKSLWALQFEMSIYDRKLSEAQKALDSIPTPKIQGVKPNITGSRLLVDDFEPGSGKNYLGGTWTTDCDHNNLGTLLKPMPFTVATGGSPKSPQYAAHILGHYGRSIAPWPYAMLTVTLNSSGGPEDLSDFKSVEFYAKGDGKNYSVILARAAVEDYCNFRNDFKAPSEWTKVTINLSDFSQPAWGKQVPPGLKDVLYLAFTPNADFSDEDFDLWIDDLTLLK